jgi:hypothetical protein
MQKKLMDAAHNSPGENELLLLATMIEEYEEKHYGRVKLQFIPDIQGAEPINIGNDLFDGKIYDDDRERE